jgi:hypothetical protein
MGLGLVNWIYWPPAYPTWNYTLQNIDTHRLVPSVYTVSTSHFLATASTKGDSSASHLQVLFVTATRAESLPSDNSSNWVPGWQPFHTSLHRLTTNWQLLSLSLSLSLTNQLLHITSLNWTADNSLQNSTDPTYNNSTQTTYKKHHFHCHSPTIPHPLQWEPVHWAVA